MDKDYIVKQLMKLAIEMDKDMKNGVIPHDVGVKYHQIFEKDLLDKILDFGIKEGK